MRHIRDTETGLDWLEMDNEKRAESAINDPNVVWTGAAVDAMAASFVTEPEAFSDGFLRLHAPDPLEKGSSIAHWTSEAFPDLLMEPSLSRALFDQVDLTLDLFIDIGWETDLIFADGFESQP